MKNSIKVISTLSLVLFLAADCQKKKEDNTGKNLALLFLLDQNSGNCVTISKSTAADGKVTYNASGSAIPKGGCNSATMDSNLYSTSSSEVLTASQGYYDALKAVFDTDTSCSALSTASTAAKSSLTSTAIDTTKSGLTSGASGCGFVGYRVTGTKLGVAYICKDDTSITQFKARTSYQSVSSVATDMADKITDLKAFLTASKATSGLTDSAIAAARPASAAEMTILGSVAFTATLTAAFSSTTCATALATKNADVKSLYTSMAGASTSLGITTSDAAKVASAVLAYFNTPTCGYGTGFTANSSASVGSKTYTCPTSYPQF